VRAAGGEIVFGAQVDEVRWSAGAVVARCGDGRSFRAARAIVAVPLGVLKAERLRFDPYPSALSAALPGLEMGPVCRLTFVFKRRLWPDGMSFLLTGDALPAVWWTSHPEDELTLTGWTGGPRAEALLQLAPVALEAHAVGAAAEAFALTEDELRREMVSFHSFDWSADDLTRGAYSWVCVGGLEASERMSRPVEDTLFFAGEHTDTTGLWGTVHAALGSGTRAATDLLRAARIG
jgi:monoamine oxidase